MSTATANPTARPPKAPPLTTLPSTPGPQLPGGYPRDSVVFSTNQWAPPEPGAAPAKKGKGKGLLAATKAYLPPAVTSYFPQTSAPSTPIAENPSPSTPKAGGEGEGVAPLNTDGSAASDSDFSTRAYAGTPAGRGEATPTQGVAFSESELATPTNGAGELPLSKLNPASLKKPEGEPVDLAAGVVPIPSVAPFASVLTSTGRAPPSAAPPPATAADASISPVSSNLSNPNSKNSASTANTSLPASPTTPAVKKTRFVMEPMPSDSSPPSSPQPDSPSAKGFKRFTSVRRKAAPSANGDATTEDGVAPNGVGADAPTEKGTGTGKGKHSRRASLMHKLAAKMHIGHAGEKE
ncbi:hypothetical protein C8R47DRAFT_1158656 [Mycena vitilis]|nr:hypothetical protein C8R47DRAFT_1158656 [Mycena vitilis]